MALGLKPFVGASARAFDAPLVRLNVYDGAVRSSKTITALVRWAKWVKDEAPQGTLMVSGKTERTVKQNIVDPLYDIFGPRRVRYSAGNHELWLFGRKHIIVGANDERAEAKIRGITLAGILGDEVTLWAESFFKMSLSRMSVPGAAFLGTTNPDSPVHWLNVEYLQRASELGLERHVFTLHDNPHLDPAFVKSLEMEYVGLWHKRYIEGLWVVAEGAIYDMFDPAVHCLDEPVPQGYRWRVAGIDYGTTNPTVFVAVTMLRDGRLIVHDEWRWDSKRQGKQLTTKEHSDAYFAWRKNMVKNPALERAHLSRVMCDPSANAFILQLWRDGEHYVKPADNDVNSGIMEVSSLLQRGKLLFQTSTTRILQEEMASYVWDPDASLKGEDKPMKVADHGPDALRYAIRGTRLRWRPALAA